MRNDLRQNQNGKFVSKKVKFGTNKGGMRLKRGGLRQKIGKMCVCDGTIRYIIKCAPVRAPIICVGVPLLLIGLPRLYL